MVPMDGAMARGQIPPALAALGRDRLDEAITLLPDKERRIASLRLQGLLPFGQIARCVERDHQTVSTRYRAGVRRLHRHLGLGPWEPAPPQIPAIEMEDLYTEVKVEQRVQLAVAEAYLRDPQPLAAAFGRSVTTFSTYENVDEPFYPPGRNEDLDPRMAARRIRGTNDLAAWLKHQQVGEADGLSFEYVDREVWPARTTGGVRFSDGRRASTATRLDLLLVDPRDRAPIVGEVKVGNDQHPFYALLQLLMLAAQLAPPTQRERLREWYPERFDEREARLDLLTVLYKNPAEGRYRPRLLEIACELSRKLLGYPEVADRIRRIACLDAKLTDDRLTFTPLFVHQG
jgi:hypothetical protein